MTLWRRYYPAKGDVFKSRLIILVVEDGDDDAWLLDRAFKKVGIEMPIHVCKNGDDAMDYLQAKGRYADRSKYPFPRVIITDLNMPGCSGFDLLQWLQEHPECNLIPKIVLSASVEPKDVNRAYQLGANCYFQKPSSLEKLINIVEVAQKFWAEAALPELPENC